ncbi:MAG: hypothetical protein RIR49_141 [Actinomycetota bacterium]|jgi:thiol-disulfide isomerase/thioredoxin
MAVPVRTRVLAGVAGIAVVGLVAVGAPEVRDAVSDAGVDVVLDEPGEYQQPVDATTPAADRADAFPAVDVLTADGRVVSTAALIGTPLVVNLWFAACPPCQREMPDFASVDAATGDSVRFIGVNPIDDPERMLAFAASTGVTYDLFRDPDAALTDALSTVAFPLTVFVAADGTIVGRDGVLDATRLAERIERHFGIEVPAA